MHVISAQSNKEKLVRLMKEKGDGVEESVKKLRVLLDWGTAFVLLTLPLSDPDFEAFNAGQELT